MQTLRTIHGFSRTEIIPWKYTKRRLKYKPACKQEELCLLR
jgi:hypothetical protein